MAAAFSNIRQLSLSALLLIRALAAPLNAAEPTAEEVAARLSDYESIYEVGVRVRTPRDFDVERRFHYGFGNRDTHCLLIAQKLATAFHEDFDKHAKSLQSKTILSRERVKIGEETGILLHHEKTAPPGDDHGNQFSWVLVFGNQRDSISVSGVYYANSPAETSAVLKAAVLSARRDDSPLPKPGEKLPITLELTPKLKVVTKQWRDIVLTEDGQLPPTNGAPIFTAIQFKRRELGVDSLAGFAQLMQDWEKEWAEQFEVKASDDFTIGGLQGYELKLRAISKKRKAEVNCYYVVLHHGEDVILMTGLCAAEKAGEFQPEFEAMARSVKLKVK